MVNRCVEVFGDAIKVLLQSVAQGLTLNSKWGAVEVKNTIVLADDHTIVRQALRVLVKDMGFEVIGEASDGLEAINLVNDLKPDILITDMLMGSMSGLEVTRRLTKESPKTSIVVLSMYNDESYVIEALRAGAKAYVAKGSNSEDLLRAIREALAGRRFLGSSICEQAIQTYSEKTVQIQGALRQSKRAGERSHARGIGRQDLQGRRRGPLHKLTHDRQSPGEYHA